MIFHMVVVICVGCGFRA